MHKTLVRSARLAWALVACVVGAGAAWAQDDPQDSPPVSVPIAWEVVDGFLSVEDLAVSGDSTIYLSGSDGTWVWRADGTDRFVEINDGRGYGQVLMASTGWLFLEDLSGVRLSKDYIRGSTPIAVDRGEAMIETHSGAIVVATDNLGVERSTDGGDTWTVIGRDEPVFQSVFGRFFALSPPTPDLPHGRLVLVGVGGAAVSTDDGLTWQASNLARFFGYRARTVVYSSVHDAFYTYMSGPVDDGGSESGVIRESTDGVTWTVRGRMPTGTSQRQGRLAAGADGSLWGIMEGGVDSTAQGEVYRSLDRGATWDSMGRFSGRDLVGDPLRVNDIVIDWEGRVWVGFSQGVPGQRTDGAVLRTVEPVAASADAPPLPRESGLLHGVYPNPAREVVQIDLAVTEPQTVQLRVVDLLGRTVATVHTGALAGARTFTVPTATWPPGVYVAEAQTGTLRETMRFTVVR